jgi:hypothetical protein
MKRADRQVPDELSSSFHHGLGGNVEGELLDRRRRPPGSEKPDSRSSGMCWASPRLPGGFAGGAGFTC